MYTRFPTLVPAWITIFSCMNLTQTFQNTRFSTHLNAILVLQLNAYTNGGHLIFSVLDYQRELKEVAVTAFTEALAFAVDLKKADGCLAWANAGGCIYTPEHPDATRPDCGAQDNIVEFECEALAVSAGKIEEIDALAEASAPLPSTCLVQCQ